MVMYSCPRCGYSNKIKTHIRKHFLRQVICSPTCSDTPIEECYREVLGGDFPDVSKSKYWRKSNVSNNVSICKSNVSMCKSNVSNNVSNIHKCKYCDKQYIHRQSKYTHEKTCKVRATYTKEEVEEVVAEKVAEKMADKDKLIDELKSQIEVLLTKVGDTHIQNNTYNIVLNAFGKENTSYIQGGFVKNLIKQGPYSSIPRLIKALHFDPEHKENHNIKIPNKKLALAKVYNGEEWEYKNKKDTINDLTDKAYNIIEDHYEGSNKHMNKFIDEYDNDEKTSKKVHKDTEIMILNNQDKEYNLNN